jgi:N-acetylneuraminate synthase
MIKHLINVYPDMVIGYSDHTIPDDKMLILTLAYLFGAQIIEKHFTLDKSLPGNDHYHAMDPDDIRSFKNNLQMIAKTSGKYYKEPLPCEATSRLYARRSLVATVPIAQGQTITHQMLTTKRPGTGLSPKLINQVVGRRAGKQIERDQIITWDLLN